MHLLTVHDGKKFKTIFMLFIYFCFKLFPPPGEEDEFTCTSDVYDLPPPRSVPHVMRQYELVIDIVINILSLIKNFLTLLNVVPHPDEHDNNGGN